jgi:hypothetical protein
MRAASSTRPTDAGDEWSGPPPERLDPRLVATSRTGLGISSMIAPFAAPPGRVGNGTAAAAAV